MKRTVQLLLLAASCASLSLLTTGCETIARENIISSINTGIGVSVAENPKTEMYEVKIGYIRSQFYSVPTGKTVKNESTNSAHYSNAASTTPEVVSGIRMHSGIQQLLVGLDVSESFAVGSNAVMSPAAVAMYIADAENSTKAVAAASGASAVSRSLSKVPLADAPTAAEKKLKIDTVRRSGPEGENKVKAAIAKPENGGYQSWNDFLEASVPEAKLDAILNEVSKP